MKYRWEGYQQVTEKVRENQMKYHMVLNKSEQGEAFHETVQRGLVQAERRCLFRAMPRS